MKIRIAYHLVSQENWEQITLKCIDKMKKVGLWDNANDIHMMCHYNPEQFIAFKELFKDDPRIIWHIYSDSIITRGECWTNDTLKTICESDTEEWAILRLHNKGSSIKHLGNHIQEKWRDLMEYWNIERWEFLLNKLNEGHDAAGSDWMEDPWRHFSGNIWWAKSSHIKRLPRIPLPLYPDDLAKLIDIKGAAPRHEAEAWVGLCNPKIWSAYPNLTSWSHPGYGPGWWNYNIPFNDKE